MPEAPPWNPSPPAASAPPPAHASAATPNPSPAIAQPGALADPRWMLVPDDSANPLSAPLLADSNSEGNASLLNNRMGGRWRPASAQVDPSHVGPPPPDRSHRWRHAGLELMLAQAPDARPDLHAAMQSKDPVIATNAAILLSRQHDPAADEPLLRAIRSNETNSWQRRAAVEAFAELDDPRVAADLRSLIDEHGRFTGEAARTYEPELHLELLHGLCHAENSGRSPAVEPGGEPRFTAALASPSASVRREALTALANTWSGPLPANVVRYVGDPDSSVRRAALQTLTVRQHPEALELLRQALLDQDLIVRLSAVANLGRLGGPKALAELRQMASGGTELTRAAAVAALMETGDDQIESTAIADKSWRVRRPLVAILDRASNPRPTDLAARLVADGNADIAQAAIEAVGRWPLAEAGPILLDAMEGRVYLTRKAAAQQLTKLWPPAAEFEIEAAPSRRASEMDELRRKWRADASATAAAATPREMVAPPHHNAVSSNATDGSEGGKNIAEIERLVGRLASSDLKERREAADRIRAVALVPTTDLARKSRLNDSTLERLVEFVVREPDALVWSSILTALANDDREPATRLAYAGLSHPAPEVRRRACEYLGQHPDPRHEPLLAKSLADPNPTVVEAAVRALGRLPSLDDPRPLENILAAQDHAVRVEAAEALAQFRYPSGIAALERLGYDSSPHVRLLAAAAMGRAPDRSFVPVLIHLLDDRPEISRAALDALPRAAGHDLPAATSLATDAPPNPIQRWKDWYRTGFVAPR
jgi:HEAT repeat protein